MILKTLHMCRAQERCTCHAMQACRRCCGCVAVAVALPSQPSLEHRGASKCTGTWQRCGSKVLVPWARSMVEAPHVRGTPRADTTRVAATPTRPASPHMPYHLRPPACAPCKHAGGSGIWGRVARAATAVRPPAMVAAYRYRYRYDTTPIPRLPHPAAAPATHKRTNDTLYSLSHLLAGALALCVGRGAAHCTTSSVLSNHPVAREAAAVGGNTARPRTHAAPPPRRHPRHVPV